MKDELIEVEDNDWQDHNSTKEERKRIADEKWEADKKNWQELKVEEYPNTLQGSWVQKGPYLMNKTAKLPFGVFIGMDYRLTGIDENGKPVLEKVH